MLKNLVSSLLLTIELFFNFFFFFLNEVQIKFGCQDLSLPPGQ